MDSMQVIKRNGSKQAVSLDKITDRIRSLCQMEPKLKSIDPILVSQKICNNLYNEVTTTEIDTMAALTSASLISKHYEFNQLAGRITISNLQKQIPYHLDTYLSNVKEYLADETVQVLTSYDWTKVIRPERDFLVSFFGCKTLQKAYLLKTKKQVTCEPIQYMWLRVSIGIHGDNYDAICETYDAMSTLSCTHATPTLFHAATKRPQLLSCFLLGVEDSVGGIYKAITDCAHISKWGGGIGVWAQNIRANGSRIRGTNGITSGIAPMLKVFNDTARYINQSGKRNGSFAMYLEPWHGDVFDFLDAKKNHGDENARARDLFYAMWIPDLFMKRVLKNESWTLFCPDECPGLADTWGDEFEALYERYEAEKKGKKTVQARDVWNAMIDSQIETGTPYMLYKDAANRKSNQQNLGTIRSSNLCSEIIEYSDSKEYACCTLASIALPRMVDTTSKTYRFDELGRITRILVRNLNHVIDRNYYPVPETKVSNERHRPIGIGVQGLADVYCALKMPFESKDAALLNKEMFACMYYHAMDESCELAKKEGPYSTFQGSPLSKGKFQFDLWGVEPVTSLRDGTVFDWDSLKKKVMEHGVRNSLLLAPMPTASTSQILGNTECFEPYTSNIFTRRTLAGDFMLINQYLQQELIEMGIWDDTMKHWIISNRGSITPIPGIPKEMKDRYKTAWEMSQKALIDQAADRGAYICQSQSLNLFMNEPNHKKIGSMHMYSWKKGLKTGQYYLRTRPKAHAQQFTVDPDMLKKLRSMEVKDEDEECLMCGS